MKRFVLAALPVALLCGPALAQSADVTVLAASCATCHGPALEGAGVTPSLKGQRSAEMAAILRDFQSGTRPGTIMTRLSKGWSAAEIDALAAKLGEAK